MAANDETSVACPATRRDGRRRPRLKKRKEPEKKLMPANFGSEKSQNLSPQTSKLKLQS